LSWAVLLELPDCAGAWYYQKRGHCGAGAPPAAAVGSSQGLALSPLALWIPFAQETPGGSWRVTSARKEQVRHFVPSAHAPARIRT
jgi:hypothetical protein